MPISDPKSTPNALTPQEMEVYVKQVLVPIIDDFTKNHKGKQFTADDVEALYDKLNIYLLLGIHVLIIILVTIDS